MGLEKELWLFQQNETQGRNRVTKSCYTLQAQIQFILLLPLAWDGAERAELPKEWQGHVHSDGGKCPSWASPSSTLLTSCCCWTVGSWMLQIKITSLASQNNPSSPQGSDPSRCRDSELWLMRLGAHSHHGPRAAQMALDALGSCVLTQAQPAGWSSQILSQTGDPFMLLTPTLQCHQALLSPSSQLGGLCAVWAWSGAGSQPAQTRVRTGSGCSPTPGSSWADIAKLLESIRVENKMVILYLKGWMWWVWSHPSVRNSRSLV